VGSFPRFHEDKFHEDKGREISVNPVRKFERGFKPLPTLYLFSNSALSDGDSFLTGLISHELPTYPPLISPPKRGLSSFTSRNFNYIYYII